MPPRRGDRRSRDGSRLVDPPRRRRRVRAETARPRHRARLPTESRIRAEGHRVRGEKEAHERSALRTPCIKDLPQNAPRRREGEERREGAAQREMRGRAALLKQRRDERADLGKSVDVPRRACTTTRRAARPTAHLRATTTATPDALEEPQNIGRN